MGSIGKEAAREQGGALFVAVLCGRVKDVAPSMSAPVYL